MTARAKRIYILIIKVNKLLSFFSSRCFQKVPKLSQGDAQVCEGKLTVAECFKSLQLFQNNKSPGSNGLTVEFYKAFWRDISSFLISALNYGFDSGHLSVTQRREVVKLIPKKDAELYFIKNWTLVTLLNTDCKIATKSSSKPYQPWSNWIFEKQTYRQKYQTHWLYYPIRHRKEYPGLVTFYWLWKGLWFSRMVLHTWHIKILRLRCFVN